MKNVVIRAPLLTSSGYGVHSRQIFKWLVNNSDFKVRAECVGWGQTPWLINPEFENGLIGQIMDKSADAENNEKADISFQVQLPDEWDINLANFNVGVTAAVETDKCNTAWIDNVNKMDLVIVPSKHIKRTLENSGPVRTPVIVVPESYHESISADDGTSLDLPISTKFNFLILGQFTSGNHEADRKNILNTIKWLCEAFKDDPDVGIVLKTNHGKHEVWLK